MRSALLLAFVLSLAALAPMAAQRGPSVTGFESFVVENPVGRPIVFHFVPADSEVAAVLASKSRGFVPGPVVGMGLPRDSFDVVVAPGEAAFAELTGGRVPDWGLAVAFPRIRRIVIRSPRLTGSTGADPAVVLRHELGHLYLAAAAGPGSDEIPRWFNEGFAALYAQEWRWVAPYRLAWARLTGGLTPLSELHDTFPETGAPTVAYVQSMAAVRSLQERGGDAGVRALLQRVRDGATFDAALRETYGLTLDKFYADWEEELGSEYGWAVALTDERGLWVAMAVLVILFWAWRRLTIKREIAERKREEDAALGEPDDRTLGVERQERYWEWDEEQWREDEEDDGDDWRGGTGTRTL